MEEARGEVLSGDDTDNGFAQIDPLIVNFQPIPEALLIMNTIVVHFLIPNLRVIFALRLGPRCEYRGKEYSVP